MGNMIPWNYLWIWDNRKENRPGMDKGVSETILINSSIDKLEKNNEFFKDMRYYWLWS